MPANLAIEPRMLLNDREAAILRLMAQGASCAEILECVHYSHSSLKRYRRQIYQKLGVRDSLQAVLWYHDVDCNAESQPHTNPQISFLGEPLPTILSLIARGYGTAEIVTATKCSSSTIKRYIKQLYDILGIWTRVQAALWFHEKPILFQNSNDGRDVT